MKFSCFCSRVIYALFALLGAAVLIYGLAIRPTGAELFATAGLFAALCAACAFAVRHPPKKMPPLWLLAAVCAAVKLAWVLIFRVEPASDYLTFFDAASQMRGFSVMSGGLENYLALFPHIFGYSFFLSLLFSVFGASPMLAALVNVLLSVLSMLLIHYICKKLISDEAAAAAALLWIVFPSQTVYNMFVLSEPYYTVLLLAAAALAIKARERLGGSPPKLLIPGLLTGAALGLVNAARPVGLIMLIALAAWLLVIDPLASAEKNWTSRLLFMAALLAAFWLVSQGNRLLFESLTGVSMAGLPGYSVYVGFNGSSYGSWNQEDSELLYALERELGAAGAQKRMLELAIERIKYGNLNFLSLFAHKGITLWGSDDVCVRYAGDAISHQLAASCVCGAFYLFAWLGAIAGSVRAFINKSSGALVVFPLYLLGLTAAHMLTEVAPRYHYSGIPVIIILFCFSIRFRHSADM